MKDEWCAVCGEHSGHVVHEEGALVMVLKRLSLRQQTAPAGQYWFSPDKYDLSPPYQRASVWTDGQRVRLLQSLFEGLPVGAVVVNFRGYDTQTTYAVVDGKQRIETLRSFIADGFAVPASWFETCDVDAVVAGPGGEPSVVFSGLCRRLQRTVEDFPIATLVAQVATVADEAALYDRINTSGTQHTDAELALAREVAGS